MTKILLAIPTAKYIEADTFKSVWNLGIPAGVELHLEFFFGYNIDDVRNLAANFALGNGFDYLFFVDSDIVLPRNALDALLKINRGISTGWYYQKSDPVKTAEIYFQWPDGSIMPKNNVEWGEGVSEDPLDVAGCGMGCCLIRCDVLHKVGYPQFETKKTHSASIRGVSEDVSFCIKARKIGYTITLDPMIKCPHIGSKVYE